MGLRSMFRGAAPPAPAAPAPAAVPPAPSPADLVAQFEAFRAFPYMPTPQDRPTIGYGTTRYPTGQAVRLDDPPCTEAQARAWLALDVAAREATVAGCVTVPLTEAMRVALVSFEYNTGALAGSTLLRKLNAGDYAGAAAEFPRWVKQKGKTLGGLVKRRAFERALFESQGWPR